MNEPLEFPAYVGGEELSAMNKALGHQLVVRDEIEWGLEFSPCSCKHTELAEFSIRGF